MIKVGLVLCTSLMIAMVFPDWKETSKKNEETFNEVTIGNQVWMSENLKVDKFRNGVPIPQAKTQEEWRSLIVKEQPAWCYFNNDPANGLQHGKMYNWYAVNDPRGLAPNGWHIPSDLEWTQLSDFLGEDVAGNKIKSTSGWYDNGNGTNESGFSCYPSSYRSELGSFARIGETSVLWSSTAKSSDFDAWVRYLHWDFDNITRGSRSKNFGLSVRCLKD